MKRGLEVIRTSEGFPPSTPLPTVWKAVMLGSEVEMEKERRFAMTLVRMMSAMEKGGTFLDVANHLYPPNAIMEIKATQKEIEQENAEIRRLEMFRRIAKRFDNDRGRHND